MSRGLPLLQWLDRHPQAYLWLVGTLIGGALGLALVAWFRAKASDHRQHDWPWAWVIVAVLAAGRWPSFLINREFNPDESRHLAGAHALLHDPVFWRSVDGATSGPLNYFSLCPAGWLLGWDAYLPARLTAFVLLALCLLFLHQVMALRFGQGAARLASLPVLCFEALTVSIDLLPYSTELLSLALIAVALYAAVRRWAGAGNPLWGGLGGLMLGAVPFAKLQAVPLAACLGLAWFAAELLALRTRPARRPLAYLLGGAFLPACLFAWQLTIAGLWPDFLFAYFQSNAQYASSGLPSFAQLLELLVIKSAQEDSLLHLWLPGTLVWLGLLAKPPRSPDRARWLWPLVGFAGTALVIGVVLAPGRPFLHYWHFTILPLPFLTGALLNNVASSATVSPRHRWFAASGAIILVTVLTGQRFRQPNPFVGWLAAVAERPRSELASRVATHVKPGETIAIWGWSSYVYVEAGVRPAAREADFGQWLLSGPHRQKYGERILLDIIRTMPPLFLDSTGPCTVIYPSPKLAHDLVFPELAAIIRTHYVLVEQFMGARLYLRRDRMPSPPP